MVMAFGAAQDSSSSFFVFAGSIGFEGLQDLAVIVFEPICQFFNGSEAKFNHKTFEQSGTDIPVGLVFMLSVGVDPSNVFLQRLVQCGLKVVQDEMVIDVLPAIIDGVCREVGQLKKGLDNKETGLNAPTLAIDFTEVSPVIFLFIKQGRQEHLDLAIGQGDADQAVSDAWVRLQMNAQFRQPLFGLDLEWFFDNLLVFTT